jgi:hypothetical protein
MLTYFVFNNERKSTFQVELSMSEMEELSSKLISTFEMKDFSIYFQDSFPSGKPKEAVVKMILSNDETCTLLSFLRRGNTARDWISKFTGV